MPFFNRFVLLAPLLTMVVALPHICVEGESNLSHTSTLSVGNGKQVPLSISSSMVWQGCTAQEDQVIGIARTQFVLIARGAIRYYDAITAPGVEASIRQDAQATHRYRFGDLATVPGKMQTWNRIIIQQLYKNAVPGYNDNPDPTQSSRLAFRCEPVDPAGSWSCKEDYYAYTTPGSSEVTICPLFFAKSRLDWKLLTNEKERLSAGTIAHEITHSRRLIGVFDGQPIPDQPYTTDKVGYGAKTCHDAAMNNPVGAILNADNYKWYFQRAFFQYCQCSPYEGTREDASPEKRDICGPFWAAVKEPSEWKCAIS